MNLTYALAYVKNYIQMDLKDKQVSVLTIAWLLCFRTTRWCCCIYLCNL